MMQAYAHGHERLESLILKLSNDRAPRLPNGRVLLSLTQRPASPGTSNMTQVRFSSKRFGETMQQGRLLASSIHVWQALDKR